MAERRWEAAGYTVVVVAAGITYWLAQTAINSHQATLPVRTYLDCLQKVSAYDWDNFEGERPSSSEVCENLTSREKI